MCFSPGEIADPPLHEDLEVGLSNTLPVTYMLQDRGMMFHKTDIEDRSQHL
jgi:hypothetical protein